MRLRWLIWIGLFVAIAAQASAQIVYVVPTPPDGTFPTTQLRQVQPNGTGDAAIPLPGIPLPQGPTFSHDGRFVAMVSRNPLTPLSRSQSVYELDRVTGLTRLLLPFDDITNPDTSVDSNTPMALAYSPDNQRIAVAVETIFGANTGAPVGVIGVEVRSLATGLLTFLYGGATQDGIHTSARGIDWSPSGVALALPAVRVGPNNVASITPIFLTDPNNGNIFSQLTNPVDQLISGFPVITRGEHDFAPAFSPNGAGVAYFRASQTRDSTANPQTQPLLQVSLRIIATNGSNDRAVALLPEGWLGTRVRWSPDGTQLVFDAGPRATLLGFPILLPDPTQLATFIIDVDGTDLATLRSAPAISPAWAPGSGSGDQDGDGVDDSSDNCSEESNGGQEDVDADDFGNACDGDFNQDDFVGGPDFDIFLACFNRSTGPGIGPPDDPACEESDMNADGFVGGPDFDLFLGVFNGPPGPTGRAGCGLGWELAWLAPLLWRGGGGARRQGGAR